MNRFATALLPAAVLAGYGVSCAQTTNDDQAIQGTWTVVAQRIGDRASASSEIKNMKVVIDAKKLVIIKLEEAKGGGTYELKQEMTYRLESSKMPKAIDLGHLAFRKGAKGPEVVETWPGIYEFKENFLKIAFDRGRRAKKKADGSIEDEGKSAVRPKNLEGGPNITVFTLEREKMRK